MNLEQVRPDAGSLQAEEEKKYQDEMIELESLWFKYRVGVSDDQTEVLARINELGLNTPENQLRIAGGKLEELQGIVIEHAILSGSEGYGSRASQWFRDAFIDSQAAHDLYVEWQKNRANREVLQEIDRLFAASHH